MLYLIAAILGSSSLVILLKVFDLKGVNLYLGITVNYLVAAILSFAFAPEHMGVAEIWNAPWMTIAAVVGAMFMISFVIYAISAQRSGVAITTISGRAAVVIPVVFAFAVLGERPTALKIAMLLLILVAMVLILRKSGGGERQSGAAFSWTLLLPVAVFLFNGVNDTMVQYAQRELIPSGGDVYPIFNGTMFVAGTLTGLICYLISCIRRPHRPAWRDLLWGSVLGFMNWVCMIGVLYALDVYPGSVFYPLYYTGAIVISTVVGVWVFKEKLSPLNYAGIAIAVIAIAVLSTL